MKRFMSASVKSALLGLATMVIVGADYGTARANAVNFVGSTAGCFNCGLTGPFGSTASMVN